MTDELVGVILRGGAGCIDFGGVHAGPLGVDIPGLTFHTAHSGWRTYLTVGDQTFVTGIGIDVQIILRVAGICNIVALRTDLLRVIGAAVVVGAVLTVDRA